MDTLISAQFHCFCKTGSGLFCKSLHQLKHILFHFPAAWRDDGRCGLKFPLPNGQPTQCDPNANFNEGELKSIETFLVCLPVGPCCSTGGWCGSSIYHCCSWHRKKCVDYREFWAKSGTILTLPSDGAPSIPLPSFDILTKQKKRLHPSYSK